MEEIRVLVASRRPAIHRHLSEVAPHGRRPIAVVEGPDTAEAVASRAQEVAAATVAVVDVRSDAQGGARLCGALRQQRPGLPILALLCCPEAASPWDVVALLAAGARSVRDLEAPARQLAREIESLVGGETALNVRLAGGRGALVRELILGDAAAGPRRRGRSPAAAGAGLAGLSTDDLRLLPPVAQGLSNRAIGRQFNLSADGINHRLARLCGLLHAGNRVQLAVVAAQHGLHHPPPPAALEALAGLRGERRAP
jgi:DNA-binding NarL/FixJ family response regulator